MTERLVATPSRLRHLALTLGLDEATYRRAVELAGFAPDGAGWAARIDRFLLVCGILFLLAGIAAFFAYNWADLHKFAKFGLIQTGIVVAALLAWRRGLDSPAGRGALFAAAFLTGLLLALYGQVYQTGADPYGLFLAWALLIAPWVVIGRQAAMWMLLLVLLNLSLALYWSQVIVGVSDLSSLLGPLVGLSSMLFDSRLGAMLFGLNAGALVAWEFGAARGFCGTGRWFPRIVALGALVPAGAGAWLWLLGVVTLDEAAGWRVVCLGFFAAFVVFSFWYYRLRVRDLFILTAGLAGGIVLLTSYLGRMIGFDDNTGLVLAMLLLAQTAGAAFLLRSIYREWETS